MKADTCAGVGGGTAAKIGGSLKEHRAQPTSIPSAIPPPPPWSWPTAPTTPTPSSRPAPACRSRGRPAPSRRTPRTTSSPSPSHPPSWSRSPTSAARSPSSRGRRGRRVQLPQRADARIGDGAIVNVADAMTVRGRGRDPEPDHHRRPVPAAHQPDRSSRRPPSPTIGGGDPLATAGRSSRRPRASTSRGPRTASQRRSGSSTA